MTKFSEYQWLSERNLFVLTCLLCGLPVWLPHFPPMTDIPQHASQVSTFLSLNNPDFPFSNEFQFNLFTPYLFGYFLIVVATPLLGIVAACKMVIWLALAAFMLSSRYLLRQTGADPYWAWLAFPALYGFSYQWGFLNFLIAAPLGMIFLGVIWKKGGECNLKFSLSVVLMLHALFFCHALIFGLFCIIAVAYWWFSTERMRDFFKCAWPIITLVPIVIVWFVIASKDPKSSHPIRWDLSWINSVDFYYSYAASWINQLVPGWGRVNGFIPRMFGVRPNIFLTLTGITVFVLPYLAGGKFSKFGVRYIPLIVILLVLFLLPDVLLGTAFTFQRFSIFFIPLLLIVIESPLKQSLIQRYLRFSAPLIAVIWIAFMSNNALKFDKEAEGFENVLSQMEPHKRAMSLIFERDDDYFIAPPFLHFPSWYSALKGGIANPSFALYSRLPIGYKPVYRPKVELGLAWRPQLFDWKDHEGYIYDYFVVRAPVEVLKSTACGVDLVTHSGQWWLYRRSLGC